MNLTQFKAYQFNQYSLAIESGIDTSLVEPILVESILAESRLAEPRLVEPRLAEPKLVAEVVACDDSTIDEAGSFDQNLYSPDLTLSRNDDSTGLQLQWQSPTLGELNFNIDVRALVKQHYSFPIPKQGAFNQALGKRSKTIIDASGGWGSDAILMAMQGYHVTVIERQPIMALLLQDAFYRFAQIEWVQNNAVAVPTLMLANAQNKLCDKTLVADCVYFDPMFPPKRKKSAAVNKHMQLLQWLVGQDADAAEVLSAFVAANVPRIAVKRPHHAEPLLESPSEQFSSKLVHYDVYLNH